MKTKLLMVLGLLVSVSAFADRDFTLVDNNTGTRYFCDMNGGGGGGGGGTDQRCVENVANYCYSNTSYGRNTCFEKASTACRNGNSGFSACVASSADYCYNNTSYGRNECFERAIPACGGNFDAIRELVEGAKSKALIDAKIRL